MAALCDKFRETLNGVRAVGITHDEARSLVRLAIGWPRLSEDPKPSERTGQETLDADLESRLHGYLHELWDNAYAAFNTMPDIAARPPPARRKAPVSAATGRTSNAAPVRGSGISATWHPDPVLPFRGI